MPRDDPHRSRDPEDRRASDRSASKAGPVARALARGRSGHGAESVRPHLNDQLVLKSLLRPSFPDRPDTDVTEHDRGA